MRRPMAKKVLAATMAAAMTMSVAACGETTSTPAPVASTSTETVASTSVEEVEEEEVSPYTVITDANGNAIDLGGMELIIRDWWSGPAEEPRNDYEEAREEYREWIQEKYNFTVTVTAISDWNSTPQDFIDYVTTGGDDKAYVFTLDGRSSSAAAEGMMYDLATLDCLDFSEAKFANYTHKLYTIGDSIYAMNTGKPEPRTGIWFNKRVLTEANINPDDIYKMQADGTWTWDAFVELLDAVQRDTNNDGEIDVWGFAANESYLINAAVYSNGGEYVGMEDGKFVYKLENPETIEALEWVNDLIAKYDEPAPADANWDYYKQQVNNGECAFFPDDSYCGTKGNNLCDSEDDFGFVMFPKGPNSSTYVNFMANNIMVIPACYSPEKAWNVAFAFNLWTDTSWPAGYEDYTDYTNLYAGKFDDDAVKTYEMMMEDEHAIITYDTLVPHLLKGEDLTYSINGTTPISTLVEQIATTWKGYIDDANAKN